MLTICDTHPLVYDAMLPDRLGHKASAAIDSAFHRGELACSDVSLWEIAMLMAKGRLGVDMPAQPFIERIVLARRLSVLPITPAIAAVAASGRIPHGDPADRLIAATAIVHHAALVTRDRRLAGIPGLATVW